MRIAVPLDTSEGLKSRVSFLFGRAPYIALVEYEDSVRNVRVETNPYAQVPGGAGHSLAQHLRDEGVDMVLASDVGPYAASTLTSYGIRWVPVPASLTLEEALQYLSSPPPAYAAPPAIPTFPFSSREEEIMWLRERKKWIERRLEEIERRLNQL